MLMSITRFGGLLALSALPCLIVPATAASGAEDAGLQGVQQNQLQRQQQQEALRLRMQQQQTTVQSAPADAGKRQAQEQLQREQLQRQQQLHYRQAIESAPVPATAADDEATRRAKAELARQKAQQESERQLQRLDDELKQKK